MELCFFIIEMLKDVIMLLSTRFLQFLQDLSNQQQSCKRCLSVIERNLHTLQRALSTSKVLRNFDLTLLQKRVAEIQGSAQVSIINACTCSATQVTVPMSLLKVMR